MNGDGEEGEDDLRRKTYVMKKMIEVLFGMVTLSSYLLRREWDILHVPSWWWAVFKAVVRLTHELCCWSPGCVPRTRTRERGCGSICRACWRPTATCGRTTRASWWRWGALLLRALTPCLMLPLKLEKEIRRSKNLRQHVASHHNNKLITTCCPAVISYWLRIVKQMIRKSNVVHEAHVV